MDARTRLAIGGMTAVAASVAVVCAVALTNTAALKDSPATTVAAPKILVPAAAPATIPTSTVTPTAEAVVTPMVTPQAEVVAAPDPTEVEPRSGAVTPQRAAPAPAAPEAPIADDGPADIEEAIAAAQAAGTWDVLRAWAERHGWSTGRLEALIARLERGSDDDSQGQDESAPAQKQPGPGDLQAGLVAGQQSDSNGKTTSEHPAKAGSNGHGNGVGPDTKKDQSRNSPDRRD